MLLDRLLGTWDVTMHHSAMSEPVAGQQCYERVLDGAFVMVHWTYHHRDFPDAVALLDERRYHYFDVRGVTRVFDLTVEATGWAMIRRDQDFWQRSAGIFQSADAIAVTGENSADAGATWQHDFSMTCRRVR